MSGPHFHDHHLLLDDHGDQLFAMTDDIAERVRKIGGTTVRSSDAEYVTPADMLSELHEDEKGFTLRMRAVHSLCDDAGDVATASLPENWIDQSQRRSWFCLKRPAPEIPEAMMPAMHGGYFQSEVRPASSNPKQAEYETKHHCGKRCGREL